MSVRNVCFTAWSPVEESVWETINVDFTYMVVGEEVCPDTGRVHWQGYVEFAKQKRFNGIKTWLKQNDVHIEKRKGSAEQAANYCKKDGKYREEGVMSKQGKRTDLQIIREMVQGGACDADIVAEVTSVQAVKAIDTVRQKMIKPRTKDEKPTVYWFWGATGTGKSRRVKDETNDDYDDCNYANNFLIGYTGNETVVFDDFRGQIPLYLLLKMLDYGRCTVNVKGGSCFFAAKTIYITSHGPPDYVYKNITSENIDQLTRRITEVICFDPPELCPAE